MQRRSMILIWCVGIAFIIGVTIYSEIKTRPTDLFEIRYIPSETSGTTLPTVATSVLPSSTATDSVPEAVKTETTALPLCRDLNTATVSDLERVEGIGPELAGRIVAEREALGGFRRRAELLSVSGIGEVLMERILTEFEIPMELPPLPVVTTTEPPPPATPPMTVSNETLPVLPPEEAPCFYDLNLVTKEELCRIPGMDESMAEEILSLREKIGYFSNIRELVLIDGMDPTYILTVLSEHLCIAGSETTVPT